MRLHVDLFIKYVSNNVYSDNNHGQPQSILNIFLTFFSSLYFMTTFCGLFRFFLLGGMKMSGSAGLFNKKKQGNSVARDLPRTGSETNTTIFVIYILDIDSHCTIWGNHLQLTSCKNSLHVYLRFGQTTSHLTSK